MRTRMACVMLELLSWSWAAFAAQELGCYAYAYRDSSPPSRRALWDGYEVSVGPTPAARENPDYGCTAAIYNRAGRVVFRTTGFNVVFDEDGTGMDFDGDGKAEVVLKSDTGGGNHCCWSYHVVSLWPKPHELVEIPEPGAVRFEEDQQGRVVIWAHTPGPTGVGPLAERPFADRALRFSAGKFVDVTSEFCADMFSDSNQTFWQLTPERIRRFQSARGSSESWSQQEKETADVLLSRALQRVFCRQYEEALSDLDLWPEATREGMKADFAKSVKEDYPDFATRLTRSVRK